MKTEHRFLTRREGKKGHHETKLEIDWLGVTDHQLRTLAAWAIIHEVQARYFKGEDAIPEKDLVVAAELAKEKPMLALKFSPPPPKLRISKEFEALLKGLSKEELTTLLGAPTETEDDPA